MYKNKPVNKEKYVPRVVPGAKHSFALGFPNSYYCGMSNLGMQAIYNAVNQRGDTCCERFFYDRNADGRIRTLETGRPAGEFPLIGISVSFEMDYFNLADMVCALDIPLRAAERNAADPFVIGGGPCLSNNPEPVAEIFDAIVIGEGEEAVNDIMDQYYRARDKSRKEILAEFAKIPGVYVPLLKNDTKRRIVSDAGYLPAHSAVVAENTEFSNMYLLEIARGCGRHCRFCMAGYSTRPPRTVGIDKLLPLLALPEADKLRIGLVGCAVSDYPDIDELCRFLVEKKLRFSVASLRADSVSDILLNALAACGHKTVTFAPEAGSDRLRAVINKSITEENLLDAVTRAAKAGIANIRLYFMIGLPGETEDDINEIVKLAAKVLSTQRRYYPAARLTLSVNPFIPKPNTPFQRMPFAQPKQLKQKMEIIRQAVKRLAGADVKFENIRQTVVQAMLARGGREMLDWIAEAAAAGGYKAWRGVLKNRGIEEEVLLGEIPPTASLPWKHIDVLITKDFFEAECKSASRGQYSSACTAGCKKCGVCGNV